MRIRLLPKKARRIYQEDGIVSLFIAARKYIRETTKKGAYQKRRVDIEDRYEMISTYIDQSDSNLLDIGCADGRLTSKFNKEIDLFCIGIDVSVSRINTARVNFEIEQDIGFILQDVTPTNIQKFPEFDIVLLLTVYHHWCRHFGIEKSEKMLDHLAKKSKKLFFEPPGRPIDDINIDDRQYEDINGYYHTYLNSVFDETVEITHIGTARYMDGDRRDPIFFIDCESYN